MDDLKELTETLVQVRIEIARLGEKVDAIKDLSSKVQEIDARLTATESSAKQAHKRLDEISSNTTWLWRTVGAVFLVGAVNAVIQYMGQGVSP